MVRGKNSEACDVLSRGSEKKFYTTRQGIVWYKNKNLLVATSMMQIQSKTIIRLAFLLYICSIMKKFILFYILLLLAGTSTTLKAQVTPKNPFGDKTDEFGNLVDQYGNQIDPSTRPDVDSTDVQVKSLPPTLYMWHVDERLGNVERIAADTARLNYQNSNLTEGMNGSYNYLGNEGAPRLSRIFFDRRDAEPSIFMEPYSFFFVRPSAFNFTNSNVPYTNLTYHKAGSKINGEERFKAYFSVNVNKALAFGVNFDYLYGRGYYDSSNTAHFNAAPFLSYMGDKFESTFLYSYNYLKANQNGGITDDRYITRPEDMASGGKITESNNIPTVMTQATTRIKNSYVYAANRYKVGFYRDKARAEGDTLPPRKEFVPVTSFIHTIKVDWSKYGFTSGDNLTDYYQHTYLDPENTAIADSTSFIRVKNTLGISLLEGFNKYAKSGLTAFASHQFSKYSLMSNEEGRTDYIKEHEFYVGAELAKRQGNIFHYHAVGEVGLLGEAIGQFSVNGDLDFNFPMFNDTVSLIARGEISNKLASFYMRHYHSKHFYWDDNMDKEFRTRIEGELRIARWRTRLKGGVENVKNYTYFNKEALPEQNASSIQVMSATLNQDFKIGMFHWDNEVTWQKSSNEDVLPLPDFSIYSNLYMDFTLAKKVLKVQLGGDVRYFTEYYAPAFMAATGQFYLQPDEDRVKIGNYPIVNVYLNAQLKRTRIYVMMYHVNQGMGNSNYFYAPHYPINPRLLKIGISWNFYD